jgi:hypothetical protein
MAVTVYLINGCLFLLHFRKEYKNENLTVLHNFSLFQPASPLIRHACCASIELMKNIILNL